MNEHRIGTQQEWQAERDELLKAEKELTRRSDELATKRRALPWVPVDNGYRFETENGSVTLVDLFDGCSQLLVYHFMFGPGWEAGCPVCCSIDGYPRSPGRPPESPRRHSVAYLPRAAREAASL